MNPTLQTDHNSELKRGSYSLLKLGCANSMAAQWRWLQLKIGATSHEIFERTTYGFEAQEVRNPVLQTDCNSELKQERYGWLNQGCAKGMQLLDWARANLFFIVWAQFLGLFLGFFVEIGPIGFFFFH